MYQKEYMPCMMNPMAMPHHCEPMMAMPHHCGSMMTMPQHCGPMMTMPQQHLEDMYPKTYHIVYPCVQHHCDMLDMNYGCTYCPTKEQVDDMCDRICKEVEKDVEACMKDEMREEEDRQIGFGGRFLLRALVGTLIIRELLRRRRGFGFPFFGSPGYGNPGFGY
jgi:hypothetical protein